MRNSYWSNIVNMVWYWSNIKIYYIVPHTVCNTHPSPLFASSPQLVTWRNRQKSSTSSSTSASADAGSTCLAATARWGLVRSLHVTPGHWGLIIPRPPSRSARRRKVRVVMLHGQIAMYCRFFLTFADRLFGHSTKTSPDAYLPFCYCLLNIYYSLPATSPQRLGLIPEGGEGL